MRITLLSLFSTILVFSAASGSILEEGSGIVYGKDHVFGLKAPKGWMLDNESAVKQGLHAVFYPKGSNWKESLIVAYTQTRRRTDEIATADDVAKANIKDFHANGSPKYEGKRIKTLATDSGREAVIYHYSGDQWGNSEAVAYFVEKKTINFIVLTCRDPKLFTDSLESFDALVKSYTFMGDEPIDPSKFKAEILKKTETEK